VILHTGVVPNEAIARRPGWEKIPAVQTRRVFIVNRDRISRAGPAIVDAFEELVDILAQPAAHP
jgi:ABC-type Fe3+-hydroxamate transport system substrate-binding protein